MEPLYNFKVANTAVLSSWLDFLLDHLFPSFGQSFFRQSIGIPMGANCAVFLANFHLSSHEFDFEDWLVKSNSCPVFLHNILLTRRFVDNLFVPDIPDFSNFMCLDKDSMDGGIYPVSFCELNCTIMAAFAISCIWQYPKDSKHWIIDIFDKSSEPNYAGDDMIHMRHVDSNISDSVKFGVVNGQFSRF